MVVYPYLTVCDHGFILKSVKQNQHAHMCSLILLCTLCYLIFLSANNPHKKQFGHWKSLCKCQKSEFCRIRVKMLHCSGSVFTNNSPDHSLCFSSRFINMNATQLLVD